MKDARDRASMKSPTTVHPLNRNPPAWRSEAHLLLQMRCS